MPYLIGGFFGLVWFADWEIYRPKRHFHLQYTFHGHHQNQ